MLVCSSPQLIAAYHVLLRLLEPRHPPCALICFKTIQIFKCLTTLLKTSKGLDKSYSVCYNFFSQYVKELCPFPDHSLAEVCQCVGLEPSDSPLAFESHRVFKELYRFAAAWWRMSE